MFKGVTLLAVRRVARRWLPIASIPLVAVLALGFLALRAQPHPVVSALPACSSPDPIGTACPSPSTSPTDSPTATATDTPTTAPTATPTASPTAPPPTPTPTPAPTPTPTPTPFPSTGESAVLVPCGAVSNDRVGGAVAITPDGNELVVGAINTDNRDGAAYVLRRGSGGWTEDARLTVADAPEGAFGIAVAVSADGNTAMVAASLTLRGTVYVFSRGPLGWTQTAELTAGHAGGDDYQFGYAVSLSADGLTAAIWQPGYSSPGTAFVFTRSATGWTAAATLTAAAPQANDGFGESLALDASGTRLVLGYPGQSSVEVYDLNGGQWTRTATLTKAPSSTLGARVAISADGSTVLASDSGFQSATASVDAFVNGGGSWSAAASISNPGPTNGGYGTSLSLSANGTRALVGDYGALFANGTAYRSDANAGSWTTPQGLSSPLSSQYDLYGISVALDSDGGVAAIGAGGFDNTGAVVVFDGTAQRPPQTLRC